MQELRLSDWALILGASSGFGAAAARAFAHAGMHIVGVHLDRRATMPAVEALVADIRATGRQALFFNVNAADEARRREVLDAVAAHLSGTGERVRVLMHSLAFGTLKPYWEPSGDVITKANMDMTLDVMAHSLLYWTQDLLRRDLFCRNARIFAMTSAGSHAVWKTYGAVSAAKAALEAHCRQLAVELAPLDITANAICAGVTDTPALRKIPGHEAMIEVALRRNPTGRLTTVEDVAQALCALATPAARWITGNVIRVDGGEDIAG
ncbi:MAG: SDR family oxidoreductase [Myxococcota bacterium]|nr:SDR family oxidoreductase [Myxococcota bacterium]MDW8363547.1 SDR family oxidoreductase [Myxococcales bacterium]